MPRFFWLPLLAMACATGLTFVNTPGGSLARADDTEWQLKKLADELDEFQKELEKSLPRKQERVKKLLEELEALNNVLGTRKPPVNTNGAIDKVMEKGTVVRINIGSNAGLKVGHTLEVFRKMPAPKDLGMIRIVEVTATSAVGQLVPKAGAAPVELKVGDEVASQIFPDE